MGYKRFREKSILLTVIVLVYMMNSLDRGIVGSVMEMIKGEFLLSDRELGLLSGLAFSLPYAILCIPLGILTDRYSKKIILFVVVCIWSTATSFAAFAPTFLFLLLCRSIVGAAEAGTAPACLSLISDRFPVQERAGAFGLMYFGAAVGAAAASVLGGVVAEHFGWRAAFCMAGIPGLLMALLIWRAVTERSPEEPTLDRLSRPTVRNTFGHLLHTSPLIALLCGVPFAGMATFGFVTWLVPLLVREHGIALGEAGAISAVLVGGGTAIGTLTSGIIGNRLRTPRAGLAYVAVLLILGGGVAFQALHAGELMSALVLLFAWQILAASFIAPTTNAMMWFTPANMRGTVSALREVLATLIGFGAGPLVVGWISDKIGGPHSLRDAMAYTTMTSAVLAGLAFLASAALAGRFNDRTGGARLAN